MEIKFENVFFTYNKNTPIEKKVLNDININIKEGKISSIIGRSGSGKSTLIEMMNALNIPTDGLVKINNYEITNKSNKKIKDVNNLRVNIGLIFQFPEEQFFNMTVFDEISFGLKYFNYKTKDVEKRIKDSLKMVGLNDDYINRNPFTLSNGEKRKVAIASILAFNPSVIILDEPTIGLDSISKKHLIQLLRNLKTRYKKTIIIVSHDNEIVHTISDYIYVLNEGKIILEGDKYKVFENEKILKKCGIKLPNEILFSNLVLKKTGKKLRYRDNIDDIIKDVYRNAR